MTPLSIFLALSMIVGPFVWALLRCGALADQRFDRMIDADRERVRRALSSAPTDRLATGRTSLRSVPNPSTRFPRVSGEQHDEFLNGTSRRADRAGLASYPPGPARPYRPFEIVK